MTNEERQIVVKGYELTVFDEHGEVISKHRSKAYQPDFIIRSLLQDEKKGAYCTITEIYTVETVNEYCHVELPELFRDKNQWLYYKIWNPNMKDNIPYEGCVEYPYNRVGVFSIIKIASHNGLLVSFNAVNEKAAAWANRCAWEHNCSPYDYGSEKKDEEKRNDE